MDTQLALGRPTIKKSERRGGTSKRDREGTDNKVESWKTNEEYDSKKVGVINL